MISLMMCAVQLKAAEAAAELQRRIRNERMARKSTTDKVIDLVRQPDGTYGEMLQIEGQDGKAQAPEA